MNLKIKWKLQVIYDRPRGSSPNESQIRDQDTVLVPAGDKNNPSGQSFKTDNLTDGMVKIFQQGTGSG